MKTNCYFFIINLFIILTIHTTIVVCLTCNVTVNQGSLLGKVEELITAEGNYCSFKGIPYAEPPIGSLRFKAPLPAKSWEGVRNATEHGPICPQKDILSDVYRPGDEDCLFLNVYTKNVSDNAAVVVFIHGGGYKNGSGNVDIYGPDFLLRGDINIVVVTINYRLDSLGFLCLGNKEVPGNAGLKDQVLALKWVRDNIKYFGGNPNKVTIMGQSAGGASVGFHMISSMSTGLFQRAITLSGSPFNDWSLPFHPEERAIIFAKQLGYNASGSVDILSFLQNVTTESLINYTNPYVTACEQTNQMIPRQLIFTPVVEKYRGEDNFISENWMKGNFRFVNNVDLLFGFTSLEAVSIITYILDIMYPRYQKFVENYASNKVCQTLTPDACLAMGEHIKEKYLGNQTLDENVLKQFVSYVSDINFVFDAIRFNSRKPNKDTKSYMYRFDSNSSRNVYSSEGSAYNLSGPGHLDDIMNIFDPTSLNLVTNMNSTDFEIIEVFTTLIKNFVDTGNPTPDSSLNITAPEFNTKTMNYLNIGTPNLTISSYTNNSYYTYWSNLLLELGMKY